MSNYARRYRAGGENIPASGLLWLRFSTLLLIETSRRRNKKICSKKFIKIGLLLSRSLQIRNSRYKYSAFVFIYYSRLLFCFSSWKRNTEVFNHEQLKSAQIKLIKKHNVRFNHKVVILKWELNSLLFTRRRSFCCWNVRRFFFVISLMHVGFYVFIE